MKITYFFVDEKLDILLLLLLYIYYIYIYRQKWTRVSTTGKVNFHILRSKIISLQVNTEYFIFGENAVPPRNFIYGPAEFRKLF